MNEHVVIQAFSLVGKNFGRIMEDTAKRIPRTLAIQGDACIKSAAGLSDVKSGSAGGFPFGWFLFDRALLLRGSSWYKLVSSEENQKVLNAL